MKSELLVAWSRTWSMCAAVSMMAGSEMRAEGVVREERVSQGRLFVRDVLLKRDGKKQELEGGQRKNDNWGRADVQLAMTEAEEGTRRGWRRRMGEKGGMGGGLYRPGQAGALGSGASCFSLLDARLRSPPITSCRGVPSRPSRKL